MIDIHKSRQIHIMSLGSKGKVLKRTEALKMKDEVKFLDYLHDHHFQSVIIATLCHLLFPVTINISILDQFSESRCV